MKSILRSTFRQTLTALALVLCFAGGSGADASESSSKCGFSLVSCDESRLVVRFELPPWSLEPVEVLGSDWSIIRAECSEDILKAGLPVMPQYKAVVAVPPGALARAGWNAEKTIQVDPGRILPAQPAIGERPEDESEGDLSPTTSYSRDFLDMEIYPRESVIVSGPNRLRDLRVYELLIRPFSYERSSGTLRVTESLLVTLELNSSNAPGVQPAGRAGEKVYDDLYSRVLLNYEQSGAWRIPRKYGGPRLSATAFSSARSWVSIRISGSDMYALPGEQLTWAGVELSSIDPSTFRLFTGRGLMLDESLDTPRPEAGLTEVALYVTGTQDGSFDSRDRLIFYGEGLDRFTVDDTNAVSSVRHRYDNNAVYWLCWGQNAGARMNVFSLPIPQGTVPSTEAETWNHWERNTEYLKAEYKFEHYLPAPDYWAWLLEEDEQGVSERSFNLERPPTEQGNLLRYEFYGISGGSSVDYTVSLNGAELASGSNFSINRVTSGWVPLPHGLLKEQGNSFVLHGEGQVVGFFELRYLTALELSQGERLIFHQTPADGRGNPAFEVAASGPLEAFDITDPERPVRLGLEQPSQGTVRFSAPSAGSSSSGVCSFAVVADGAYRVPDEVRAEQIAELRGMTGAQYLVIAPRLLAAQAAKLAGLRSTQYSVALVSVEDIYNEFSWGPADPVAIRDFLKYAFENWPVRPQFVLLFGDGHNDFRGVTNVGRSKPNHILPYITDRDLEIEEWFVRFESSGLPQIAMGRIPVQTRAEAETVVEKIMRYEAGSDAGDWTRRVIFVADDGYGLGGTCDFVTNHVPGSEELDSLLAGDIERRKVYLDEYPFDPPGIGTRKPAANEALLNWWNRGALLINYLGHGSTFHWAQERVFSVERDLPMLNNGFRLPLVMNASCSIGHFDDYNDESMAERLLTHEGGGAVVVYAGTRITYAYQNLALNKLFVESLFRERSGVPVGLAALEARLSLGGLDQGNAQRYSIFGDPALRLHEPGRKIKIRLEGGGELKAGGKISFSGTVVDNDNAPDASFSGIAQIKFLGGGSRPVKISYQCRRLSGMVERSLSFTRTPAVLFNGPVTVSGGGLSGAFILPLNLAGSLPVDTLNVQTGSFIGYATSEATDASGSSERVMISQDVQASADSAGPVISVFSGGRELADGDRVGKSEPLMLVVQDESGINTTGSPGVQLTVEVDEGQAYAADLTSLFRYRTDSFQEGYVEIDLARVGEGLHSFRFSATDNALNAGRVELMIHVQDVRKDLTLTNVLNYPNPFNEETDICFEISSPADIIIRFFTVAGRPVKQIERYSLPAGFHTVRWDGTDEYQHKIANGVYLYKIICRSRDNGSMNGTQEVEAIGKALFSR